MKNNCRSFILKTIRLFVALALVVAANVGEGAKALVSQPTTRPNIIFILTDDQRWDSLSITGHPFMKTPNLDRIAREGALFRNAFVTLPLCSPSRASFLTGQYAHTHRVTNNEDKSALSHELVTFPRLLKQAGYETAYVGKWHMGTDDSPRPGFDRWVSFKGQGDYFNPEINVDGKAGKVEGYMTDILSDHAVEYVKRPHAKPFMLYLSHKAVHGPFRPAERHRGTLARETITRAPSAKDTLEDKPALQRKVGDLPPLGPGTGPDDAAVRNQLGTLLAVDEGVGRLLKALEETKQLENTIIIFTSDNGHFWGEHGLGDKRWAFEESIRIPLLVRYPKLIKAGATPEQFALNIDVAPTLLELAGAPVPKTMHGRSLLPLFGKKAANWRQTFLTEYFTEGRNARQQNTPPRMRTPSWQAVRGERWKYVHYTELEGMDELYDLKADPYEMKNLIKEPGAQAALKQMKAELQRLLKETS